MIAPRRAVFPMNAPRNVVGWIVGFVSSLLGDQVYFIALSVVASEFTDPAMTGLILAAASVPRLLILLIGGTIADRVSAKRIILVTDTARAAILIALAAVLFLGAESLGAVGLLVIALIFGALDGFFAPAMGAVPARIASDDQLSRMAAVRTVGQRLVLVIGGPLTGWLLALFGPAAAFGGAAVLFVVSVSSLLLLRVPRPLPYELRMMSERSIFSETVTGLKSTWANRPVFWLLVVIAATNFGFAGPVTVGYPLLGNQNDWGPIGVGYLFGGLGLGAAVTATVLLIIKRPPRAGLFAFTALGVMGASLILHGIATSLQAAVTMAVLLGLGTGAYGTLLLAHLMTITPKAEIGRVMGLLTLALEGVVPISHALTGLLTGPFGASVPFIGGGVIVLGSTLLALSQKRLRGFELPRSQK
ncbi:MFS transporter [Microlunatus speluncae]|uniref:MFS transporter n=1 Tax=Microlunatus speluncae TaxID=2594267 RepID=UPI00126679DD|nr:MFS transporter [Microlunatus speluncae]